MYSLTKEKVGACGIGAKRIAAVMVKRAGWKKSEREKKNKGMERIGVERSEKVKWVEEKPIGGKRRTLVVVVGLELGERTHSTATRTTTRRRRTPLVATYLFDGARLGVKFNT